MFVHHHLRRDMFGIGMGTLTFPGIRYSEAPTRWWTDIATSYPTGQLAPGVYPDLPDSIVFGRFAGGASVTPILARRWGFPKAPPQDWTETPGGLGCACGGGCAHCAGLGDLADGTIALPVVGDVDLKTMALMLGGVWLVSRVMSGARGVRRSFRRRRRALAAA